MVKMTKFLFWKTSAKDLSSDSFGFVLVRT